MTGERLPELSVIVPALTTRAALEPCLRALAASDYESLEVIVVDDGSPERLEPTVRDYGFRYLRLEDGPQGSPCARNRGAELAHAEYLAFVDSDVAVHSDTLERLAATFAADPELACVFGSYDDRPGDPGFFSQYKNLAHHYTHQNSRREATTFWTGCGAISRKVFIEAGGFLEERRGMEDVELGMRLVVAGHRILLDPSIQCTHLKHWTFRSMLESDIFDRAIPWLRLMLEDRELDRSLNVAMDQRISVALVGCACLALLTSAAWPPALGLAGLAVTGVIYVNRGFYRFLRSRRGWSFALRAVPVHALYFLYCGALTLAVGLEQLVRRARRGALR